MKNKLDESVIWRIVLFVFCRYGKSIFPFPLPVRHYLKEFVEWEDTQRWASGESNLSPARKEKK